MHFPLLFLFICLGKPGNSYDRKKGCRITTASESSKTPTYKISPRSNHGYIILPLGYSLLNLKYLYRYSWMTSDWYELLNGWCIKTAFVKLTSRVLDHTVLYPGYLTTEKKHHRKNSAGEITTLVSTTYCFNKYLRQSPASNSRGRQYWTTQFKISQRNIWPCPRYWKFYSLPLLHYWVKSRKTFLSRKRSKRGPNRH